MDTSTETIINDAIDRSLDGEEFSYNNAELSQETVDEISIAKALSGLEAPQASTFNLFKLLAEQNRIIDTRQSRMTFFYRAVAAAAIVATTGWGTVRAASDSTPGSLLYPVKRAEERIIEQFTFTHNRKAELNLELSERRMIESIETVNSGQIPQLQQVHDMLNYTEKAIRYASKIEGYEKTSLLSRIRNLNGRQKILLNRLMEKEQLSESKELARLLDVCSCRDDWFESLYDRKKTDKHGCPANCGCCPPDQTKLEVMLTSLPH